PDLFTWFGTRWQPVQNSSHRLLFVFQRRMAGAHAMIQLALLAVSVGLVVIGIKGFTPSGLALSKNTSLTRRSAKIVGVLSILGGLGLVPLFMLVVWAASR